MSCTAPPSHPPCGEYAASLQRGEQFFHAGNITEAEAIFTDLSRSHPQHRWAWNNLGVLSVQRKSFTEAISYFRTGFALCHNDPDLACNYMHTLARLRHWNAAREIGRLFIAAGGSEALIRPILDRLPDDERTARPSAQYLDVSVVPAVRLHEALGFDEPPAIPSANHATPLDRWKMEINDAPIFRYLYRNLHPRRHLEFGTWQGAGVVYCLEECDATVWTLNLPFGENQGDAGMAYSGNGESFGLGTSLADAWARRLGIPAQEAYRTDSFGFIGRFYLEKHLGNRVCQIYCDSTQWDTSNYPEGFFDTILIDGGHAPEVVLSDTRKALPLLRPGGVVMWHDFCPPVRNKFGVVQGVMKGLEQAAPLLSEALEKLFWIEPSWILAGVKKGNPR